MMPRVSSTDSVVCVTYATGVSIGSVEPGHLGLALHQDHLARDLADRALDFRVAGMADQDQPAAGRHVLAALHVDLGDERAGGVEHVEAAGLGIASPPPGRRRAR